jgi:hypothetical protein
MINSTSDLVCETLPELASTSIRVCESLPELKETSTLDQTHVVVITEPSLLEQYVEEWDVLATNVVEPNPFYEPRMLIPALRCLAGSRDVRVVLIFELIAGQRTLCGVFPIERFVRYKGLPVSGFKLWQHLFCGLCTPLVSRDQTSQCLDRFIDWLTSSDSSLMEFNFVTGDGLFFQLLEDCLKRRGIKSLQSEKFERALFRPREDSDAYLRAAVSQPHRKDLRRKTRRLSEVGHLEFETLESDGDLNRWIDEFLELEGRGWKGDGGAFACNELDAQYFREIAVRAFEQGKLMMLAIRLDKKAIAMKCNFMTPPGSFAFRIAFDESYSAYSPGVLLELENIRRLHGNSDIEWMDSCAIPDHPMIDRLWPDRRGIASLLMSTDKRSGELVIAGLPFMRMVNRKLRAIRGLRRQCFQVMRALRRFSSK